MVARPLGAGSGWNVALGPGAVGPRLVPTGSEASRDDVKQAPRREVHCEEAVAWLERHPPFSGCSFVTSLPDVSEVNLSLVDWEEWFQRAARLVLSRCPDDGVAVFYQTDIKREGRWIDKGYRVQRAADAEGVALLWHKIVCRAPAGLTTFGRPAYAHLLAFSRRVRAEPAQSTPDVLPRMGAMTWPRAIGLAACEVACRFVLLHTATRTVVDPFCGVGTVLAVANALGLDAVGVELSLRRARRARDLTVQSPYAK